MQTGAYSVKANAEAQLARVKAAGFEDAYITQESGGTVVATEDVYKRQALALITLCTGVRTLVLP